MKKFWFFVVACLVAVACTKEPVPEQTTVGGNPVMKSASTFTIKRSGATLRATSGKILFNTSPAMIFSTLECPKINSAFNPNPGQLCLPPGSYSYQLNYGTTEYPYTHVDIGTVWGTMKILRGTQPESVVPRGAVLPSLAINTSPVTLITNPALILQRLCDSLAPQGVLVIQ